MGYGVWGMGDGDFPVKTSGFPLGISCSRFWEWGVGSGEWGVGRNFSVKAGVFTGKSFPIPYTLYPLLPLVWFVCGFFFIFRIKV
jgi:hypothetical protein